MKKLSSEASDEKVDTSGSMLIHHSRNTAQKQWAETQVKYFLKLNENDVSSAVNFYFKVLSLSGVARVFQTKRVMLQSLEEFSRAWILLVEHIEIAALSKNSEVRNDHELLKGRLGNCNLKFLN